MKFIKVIAESEDAMQVVTVVQKYPRKNSTASVWVVKDAGSITSLDNSDYIRWSEIKKVFCAHPQTDPERAEVIAAIWRNALHSQENIDLLTKASTDGF